MIDKRDLAALQFIAVVVILITASSQEIRQFLSHVFPYGGVVIPAGAFDCCFKLCFLSILTTYGNCIHTPSTWAGSGFTRRLTQTRLNAFMGFLWLYILLINYL